MKQLFMPLVLAISALAAEPKIIVPANGVPPVGPYSPGLEVGDYVYVSGQGVRTAKSEMPEGIEAQTKQCLENVKGVLKAAGVSFDQVVSVQLYVSDLKNLPVVEKIYQAAFTKNPPHVTLATARMPTDTTVEITVAARKSGAKADRVFLPAVYGTSVADVEKKLGTALTGAGLTAKDVLYANRYVVGGTGAGQVPIHALPNDASHAIFAVAAKVPPAGYAFCEIQASDTSGAVEAQTSSVFAKLKGCLEAKGMSLENVVATNVYMDDLADFTKMNEVYASFFPVHKPTRTTVQPLPPAAKKGSLVRISAIATK